MTTALTIGILAGSTRIGSQAPKVARAISNAIVAKGHKVVMWDLTTPELKSLAIVEKPFHHYKDPATPAPATMARVQAEIVASNAVIVLGGEYNHAPLPASLAFLDNFYHETWKGKVSGIAVYSAQATGGARAASVLRNVLAELQQECINPVFSISVVFAAFKEDGTFVDAEKVKHLDSFLDTLIARALAHKK